ncbi:MAG: hypothetical protein HYS44_03590 [Candidatus Niyogibacteria bacterium]|nr:hypothetical protein [Candidatus Niyogibacteria bacterium]
MRAIAKIDQAITGHEGEIRRLQKQKHAALRRTLITCEYCKKASPLSSWGFIQDHFYVAPYSCTEGDYWGETDVECCHLICPKCSQENYIYNHPQRKKIVRLTKQIPSFEWDQLFREVRERHERH